MKMQVIGIEISEGISKKTGKPYAIGKLHTIIPLSSNNGSARGASGFSYDIDVSVLDKVKTLNLPFLAEVEMQQVMKYGTARNEIASIVPTSPKSA